MAEKNGVESPAEQIDLVVLTGGHSQWYFVKEILCGNWMPGLEGEPDSGSGVNLTKIKQEPFRIVTTPRPQETVARGLAMSGVPLKIRKLATNSTWLKLTIGRTTLEPIELFPLGEIIPTVKEIFLQPSFQYNVMGDVPVKGISLSGSELAKATELSPIDFTLKIPLWKKLGEGVSWTALIFLFLGGLVTPWLLPLIISVLLAGNSGQTNFYMEVSIDEDENWKVKGLMMLIGENNKASTRTFVINCSDLTENEEKRLAEAMFKKMADLAQANQEKTTK
jgi:hypothetical protein